MRGPGGAAGGSRPGPWHRDRALWLILGGSLVLKLVLAAIEHGAAAVLDERAYLALARGLAEGRPYLDTFRPPLYPAFLAAMLAAGLGTAGVWAGQAILSTVSTVFIYRIGARLDAPRTGRIAALIFAFDPVLVSFTHRLWSETVFLFFLLAVLDLLTARPRRRGLAWAAAGLSLGLAGLTRPMILTFAPLLLPWAWWQARKDTRDSGWPGRFVLLAVACAAVVLPWTARNARVTGGFVLVDSNGPFNFLVGTQPAAAFVDKDDFWSARYGRVDGVAYKDRVLEDAKGAQRAAVDAALANIRHAPGLFVRKTLWEAGHLWTLDSFALRHLRNGWTRRSPPGWGVALITLASAGFWVGLVVAGFAGLAGMPRSGLRGLALLLAAHSTVLFGLTYALSRYAVPLHAVLALPAAWLLASPRARLRLGWSGRPVSRRVLLAASLGFVAVAWARDLPLLGDMVLHGGSAHRFHMETEAALEAPETIP
ncbi:MAG: ArnT family glycosyltransferase [Gemmatimonadota bacterium]